MSERSGILPHQVSASIGMLGKVQRANLVQRFCYIHHRQLSPSSRALHAGHDQIRRLLSRL